MWRPSLRGRVAGHHRNSRGVAWAIAGRHLVQSHRCPARGRRDVVRRRRGDCRYLRGDRVGSTCGLGDRGAKVARTDETPPRPSRSPGGAWRASEWCGVWAIRRSNVRRALWRSRRPTEPSLRPTVAAHIGLLALLDRNAPRREPDPPTVGFGHRPGSISGGDPNGLLILPRHLEERGSKGLVDRAAQGRPRGERRAVLPIACAPSPSARYRR